MLLNFKIKNFRSIKDEIVLDLQATSDKTMLAQATFEKGDISFLKSAAIYGYNASGKSNVFKAFSVFRMMILESLLRSNLPKDLPNEFFKLNTETEDKPSFFEATFLIEEEVFIYGFEIDKKRVCKEWLKQKKGNKTLFERNKQKIESNKNYFKEATKSLKDQTGERVLFLSILSSNNKPISKKIIDFIQKTNIISGTKRGATLDYTFKEFLNNSKRAEKIKEFISKADFGVEDIQPVAQRNLKFLHNKFDKKGNKTGSKALDFFSEESEGTQQMFALSAPIIDTLEKGHVLFIDEIDSSLHPILCQYLITIFNSKKKNPKNAQLIFTTHDISFLDEKFLRRDQIYFTNKNKRGATELFSLADISERKGVNFAKRYLEGRYDALPYIAEFEDLKFSK